MIIRLHRWQAKAQRYRTQIFNTEDEAHIFYDLVAVGGIQQQMDPTVNQIIMRTQQVTRVYIDSQNNEVNIYTMPVVERNYPERRAPAGKAAIKSLGGGKETTKIAYSGVKPEAHPDHVNRGDNEWKMARTSPHYCVNCGQDYNKHHPWPELPCPSPPSQ
ncbi:MAG: hypothetical protein C5B59_12340 [Bacteroidetes bacterium]|nr:MAG: hypothetical protein C5B59_12340 [Bacteroidota bacterium]